MTSAQQESLFKIRKISRPDSSQKNIILFIMESVPLDFFDSKSPYKVYMPFLDSLVDKSTFFSHAISYSYNSNKGITAILAGLPTITDIPLYHSNYTSLQKTSIGTELAKKKYNSLFFIGDNYDDFGFAKCTKWLGLQHYYCMQDIPGYETMEKHTMGLHDEYVLHFMQQKLTHLQQPFFAAHYNISTHYPNDIPSTYIDKYPTRNLTGPMKSMQYYNDCLKQFFGEARSKPWYKNSVFIFCSDHWAQPHAKNIKIDQVESFRIPLFIYDPSNEHKKVDISTVSQLDILNTILHYANVGDSIISYGENLTDTLKQKNRAVFTKINGALYQAINDTYVLGFDAMQGREVYCYDYINDPDKKNNLLFNGQSNADIHNLAMQMKGFLQTSSNHYRNNHNN
jgi:phosphoglycerol transferase MdoB-like AlkP superfamily enzyme